ncbi:MAG: hypothetical protein ACWGMZ_05425 [Thermoguttaceae bacterium]
MFVRRCIVVSVIGSIYFLAATAAADEVRYYNENGITYRETRRTVQRPVCETKMQHTTRTVYKEELYTETKDVTQVYWLPLTTYQPDIYWVGRWNPFVEPYLETRWIPKTCWRQQTQVVKMPVACRRLVPKTQTIQTPVNTQKFVTEEVVSRVAVCGRSPQAMQAPTSATTPTLVPRYSGSINGGEPIGGIARLNQDPPRYGVDAAWRASSTR